jgi:hypothetical protein
MMNRTLAYALALALTIAVANQTAAACTCVSMPGSPRDVVHVAKGNATAIFVGTVLDVRAGSGEMELNVRFSVDRFWKGALASEVTVTTHSQSSACGYTFEPGSRYLVYCSGNPSGTFSTSICTRTRRERDAKDDVRYLGRPKRPAPSRSTPN